MGMELVVIDRILAWSKAGCQRMLPCIWRRFQEGIGAVVRAQKYVLSIKAGIQLTGIQTTQIWHNYSSRDFLRLFRPQTAALNNYVVFMRLAGRLRSPLEAEQPKKRNYLTF